jgi:hypothetical protein
MATASAVRVIIRSRTVGSFESLEWDVAERPGCGGIRPHPQSAGSGAQTASFRSLAARKAIFLLALILIA